MSSDSPYADELTHVQLMRAVEFAAHAHRNQRRKCKKRGERSIPYINHPLGVAMILIESGRVVDLDVLIAAVLHDVVEDCGVTYEQLVEKFGKTVADLVMEVTDNKADPKDKRKRDQVEHCATMSHRAKLVKLADKIYNTEDLKRGNPFGWDRRRIDGTMAWTFTIWAELRGTNAGLEDRLFLAMQDVGDHYQCSTTDLTPEGHHSRLYVLNQYYEDMAEEQRQDDIKKSKCALPLSSLDYSGMSDSEIRSLCSPPAAREPSTTAVA